MSGYRDISFKVDQPLAPPGKMDAAFDVNSAEDASSSPGPGGTRRAGNLWTAEARDDMYRRRENGESWEDICKDYPRRSRHAMQQQYSMMKKQKAIANGTWTTNRRGRKRRNPGPDPWAPKAPRKDWDAREHEEEATEDDDMVDHESEEVEEHDESESQSAYRDESNGRPLGLSRSATEPVNSVKSQQRLVSFPTQPVAINKPSSNGATPPSVPPSTSYPGIASYNGSVAPRKRRRLSQEMNHSSSAPPPSMVPNTEFIPSNVMLDRDDIIQLLQRGEERARVMNATLVAERQMERQTYEAALGRANRRISEAHDRFSVAAYEHGDNMKLARAEFSETLKLKAREHADAIEKVRKQLRTDHEAQASLVESLTRANDHLKKENDAFREGRPEREKELERENENLSAENRLLKERLEAMEKAANDKATENATAQISSDQNGLEAKGDRILNLAALNQPLRDATAAVLTEWTPLAKKISSMQDVDKMGFAQIQSAVKECNDSRGIFEVKLAELDKQLSILKMKVPNVNVGEGARPGPSTDDTVMQEAPRTPPADQPLPPKPEIKTETNGINNYPGLPSSRPPPSTAPPGK